MCGFAFNSFNQKQKTGDSIFLKKTNGICISNEQDRSRVTTAKQSLNLYKNKSFCEVSTNDEMRIACTDKK